jgi:ribosome maturation factor RimP
MIQEPVRGDGIEAGCSVIPSKVGVSEPTFFVVVMTSKDQDFVSRIERLIEPVLDSLTLELVETQWRRERNGWVLRLFIDRQPKAGSHPPGSGVTLDDCTEVNRVVGRLLDVEDMIEQAYTLEVSSPGLDRLLSKPDHFRRFAGRLVKVRVLSEEGRRTVKGRLLGLEDGLLRLDHEGFEQDIPEAQVGSVRLEPEVRWKKVEKR